MGAIPLPDSANGFFRCYHPDRQCDSNRPRWCDGRRCCVPRNSDRFVERKSVAAAAYRRSFRSVLCSRTFRTAECFRWRRRYRSSRRNNSYWPSARNGADTKERQRVEASRTGSFPGGIRTVKRSGSWAFRRFSQYAHKRRVTAGPRRAVISALAPCLSARPRTQIPAIDSSVALPYWRFDQAAPNLFTRDFMGFPTSSAPLALMPTIRFSSG